MNIFSEIISALESEEKIMLATIISTSGSTPASSLSKMIVKQNGNVSVGTIGGGCIEGDVFLHAQRLFETNKAEILTFHCNEDDIEHGLICGGTLDVLLEPVSREQLPFFNEIQSMQSNGNDCIVATFLSREGKIFFKKNISNFMMDNGALEKWRSELTISSGSALPQSFQKKIENVFFRNETQRIKTETGEWILEPIQGTPQLIIFGGGHISKYISRTATMCGFQISIIDDREKFANAERFPEAKKTYVCDYENVFDNISVTETSFIVIVTRGHQYDETVLEQALQTNAAYIGMIGSKRKVLVTYEHLISHGISPEQLASVHSPMGIEIGARTAEEIAVSVVAELIRVRKGKRFPLQHKSEMMEDVFVHIPKKQRQ